MADEKKNTEQSLKDKDGKNKKNEIDLSGPENDAPMTNRRRQSNVYDKPQGENCFSCDTGTLKWTNRNKQLGTAYCADCDVKQMRNYAWCMDSECGLTWCKPCYKKRRKARQLL